MLQIIMYYKFNRDERNNAVAISVSAIQYMNAPNKNNRGMSPSEVKLNFAAKALNDHFC